MKFSMRLLTLFLLVGSASAAPVGSNSAVNSAGGFVRPLTGPQITVNQVLNRKGNNRRTGGTQIVDGTTGTATLPPNAAATGKACALVDRSGGSKTDYVQKASWTSATSTQYTGCVFDGTWDLSAVTTLWLDLGFDISAYSETVWMLVSSDATLSSYSNYANSPNTYQNVTKMPRGFVPITMASLTNHGSPNFAAIKHIEIRFIRSGINDVDPFAAYVYGVWTDLTARPKIMLEHDDGFATFYQYGYPYMRLAGMHGTLPINEGLLNTTNYDTTAQVQEMMSAGWTVIGHDWDHANLALAPLSSYTSVTTTATVVTAQAHGLSNGASVTIAGCDEGLYNGTWTITVTNSTTFTMTLLGTPVDATARGWCYISGGVSMDKIRMEVLRNSEKMAVDGFALGGLHFAYPYGAWDPDTITMLKGAGYLTARGITSTSNGGSPWFWSFRGLGSDNGTWSLPAYVMDASSPAHTPSNILGIVDSTIANGGNLILYGHGINTSGGSVTLCTAASTPYPCCTGNGTGVGCASSTEMWQTDFQTVIDGLKLRCITNNTCDVVAVDEWYNGL